MKRNVAWFLAAVMAALVCFAFVLLWRMGHRGEVKPKKWDADGTPEVSDWSHPDLGLKWTEFEQKYFPDDVAEIKKLTAERNAYEEKLQERTREDARNERPVFSWSSDEKLKEMNASLGRKIDLLNEKTIWMRKKLLGYK